ncbi:MAG: 30S ribosome-binding factor RbfA, partial [Armatimonadetes bacterium]|nr:30S ribosome-binding factor RbfA [Armatimonadota bacterium]
MPTRRQLRVNNLLQEEISQIIRTEIHDPDIGFVTITGVEIAADLRQACVYTSVLGDEKEVRDTMAALARSSPAIRRELGNRIRLKYIPELAFELDETARHAQRIETLISKFESELQQPDHDFAPTVAQIAQLLTQQRPTAIFIHSHPDGDALGSGLALSLAL